MKKLKTVTLTGLPKPYTELLVKPGILPGQLTSTVPLQQDRIFK